MSALDFFIILLILGVILPMLGVWLVSDGWYSILHYGKNETFWHNHIFRWIRLDIGLFLICTGLLLIYMSLVFLANVSGKLI